MKGKSVMIKIYVAIFLSIFFSFELAIADTKDEQKLDTAIELMKKAVEAANKGNFILGSGLCPGYEDKPIEISGMTTQEFCATPQYKCRCL